MKNTTRSRPIRQTSFVLTIAVALAVAACTGGAGLDMPIGPVDHGCHNAEGADIGADMGGDGSGCDTR
jgi:hypothetical protein